MAVQVAASQADGIGHHTLGPSPSSAQARPREETLEEGDGTLLHMDGVEVRPAVSRSSRRISSSLGYDSSSIDHFKDKTVDSLPSIAASVVSETSQDTHSVQSEGPQEAGLLAQTAQSTRRLVKNFLGVSIPNGADLGPAPGAQPVRKKKRNRSDEDGQDVTTIVDNDVARILVGADGATSATLDRAFRPIIDQSLVAGVREEFQAVLAKFLQSDTIGERLPDQHAVFFRVVHHIFHTTSPAAGPDTVEKKSSLIRLGYKHASRARRFVSRVVSHRAFNIFFLTLTFYALLGPDAAVASCSADVQEGFLVANTFVFCAFLLELIALCMARKSYYLTLNFFLDLVSLVSVWNLTWFMRDTELSRGTLNFGAIARSTRMLRLARLARVARLTRVLPGFFHAFRRSQLTLSWHIVQRRLWRCFLVLDREQCKRITRSDVRFFYAALLQECDYMLRRGTDKLAMIRSDADVLGDGTDELDFDSFIAIFLSTRLGMAIRQWHLEEVEEDQSVWKLTSLISDSMSKKVCFGALILVAFLQVLEVSTEDRSLLMGLEQLQLMAASSHAGQLPQAAAVMCNQLGLMVDLQRSRRADILYLFLDNQTYWYENVCQAVPLPTTELDPWSHSEYLVDRYALEESNAIYWLGGSQVEQATSMVVVDKTSRVCAEAVASLYFTLCVLLLLLFFIVLLNAGLASFSKKLLRPLRTLVDDMTALSCLELVHVDEDIRNADIQLLHGAPEELQALHASFKSMQNAIQSWSKYAPPNVVRSLFNSGVEARIGVLRCTASILFCDVDGFEDLCQGLKPPEVLSILTNVLGKIAEVIHKNRGTLLEFIGDETLAVFNTPSKMANHVLAAAVSALEIHQAIDTLPEMVASDGRVVNIKCRCGVHTAEILAGNIGSHQRMKYGLLGDGINLTARMKGLNSRYRPPSRTLASQAVVLDPACMSNLACRPVDMVAVKGKKEPTTLFEISWKSNRTVQAALAQEAAFKSYQVRDFVAAKELFDEVHDMLAVDEVHDVPSRLLSARCANYIRNPPPDDWDGVDRLTKKSFDPPPAEQIRKEEKQTTASSSNSKGTSSSVCSPGLAQGTDRTNMSRWGALVQGNGAFGVAPVGPEANTGSVALSVAPVSQVAPVVPPSTSQGPGPVEAVPLHAMLCHFQCERGDQPMPNLMSLRARNLTPWALLSATAGEEQPGALEPVVPVSTTTHLESESSMCNASAQACSPFAGILCPTAGHVHAAPPEPTPGTSL